MKSCLCCRGSVPALSSALFLLPLAHAIPRTGTLLAHTP